MNGPPDRENPPPEATGDGLGYGLAGPVLAPLAPAGNPGREHQAGESAIQRALRVLCERMREGRI